MKDLKLTWDSEKPDWWPADIVQLASNRQNLPERQTKKEKDPELGPLQ